MRPAEEEPTDRVVLGVVLEMPAPRVSAKRAAAHVGFSVVPQIA